MISFSVSPETSEIAYQLIEDEESLAEFLINLAMKLQSQKPAYHAKLVEAVYNMANTPERQAVIKLGQTVILCGVK